MILDGDNVSFVSVKQKQEEEEQAAAFQVYGLVHKKRERCINNPGATTNWQKPTGLQHTRVGGGVGSTE
jgi:hypothetical protein